ncbi:hypothetical protein OG948_46540 (plasmid) [Embleya sp. NBC_00888]|uniref:hypothetical protein n=1 Tax=Embleya sp. NBC_00888 TaxID=2975960 RepID=UPI002F909589|nr:hypothetical protein OG948_46540 [Embleya sp. NBC_00888]
MITPIIGCRKRCDPWPRTPTSVAAHNSLNGRLPIPYRSESGGDYTGLTYRDGAELVPGLESPGTSGLALHLAAGPDRR